MEEEETRYAGIVCCIGLEGFNKTREYLWLYLINRLRYRRPFYDASNFIWDKLLTLEPLEPP